MTNCEVEPSVGTEREINQLISNLYGIQSGMGTALEDLEIDARVEKSDEQDEDVQVASLQDMAGEAPVIRLVNTIFSQAVREGASDIHISPQQNSVQVRFRMDGKLHDVPAPRKSSFFSNRGPDQNTGQHGYHHIESDTGRALHPEDGQKRN